MADPALMRAVFGSSSDSSDEDGEALRDGPCTSQLSTSSGCEACSIPGLVLVRALLPSPCSLKR
jgi:hypothetical protein